MRRLTAPHATAEVLSAYLDGQLKPVEEERVESHLAACEVCQSDLEGMRRVVSSLRHLERLAPPPTFEQTVVRRIAFDGRREDLMERFERGFAAFNRQSPTLFLFALVMALSIMIFFFAYALDREQRATTPVLFEAPVRSSVSRPNDVQRTIAGRDFRLQDGVWVEEGVDRAAVKRSLVENSAAARAFFAAHPELAALWSMGGVVIFTVDGEAVELRSASPVPPP